MGNSTMTSAKILINYTTRGRPERFFDGLETIYTLCSDVDNIRVLVTCDYDDTSMFNPLVKNRIEGYKNIHLIYGKSEGKIHAINRDLDLLPEEWKDWDIVANFSDDMRWNVFAWDGAIRADFFVYSPDYSHYIAYLDVDTKGALSTLYIAGRKFFDTFGFIYDPQFKSLFADNLIEDCAKRMGKYKYIPYSIYSHLLPSYGHLPPDEMYLQQQAIGWDVDQKLYHQIQSDGIDNYLLTLGVKL